MSVTDLYEPLKNAYRNFDNRPLVGENMQKFYVEGFIEKLAVEVENTLKLTQGDEKFLLIGHRGCGKSTLLNRVSEKVRDQFNCISFSGTADLNQVELEGIDILIMIHLNILDFIKKLDHPDLSELFIPFERIIEKFTSRVEVKEAGLSLFKAFTIKFGVIDRNSRHDLRKDFRDKVQILQSNLTKVFTQIKQKTKKETLILIDGLDKLPPDAADKVFVADDQVLIMPTTKIIYTFPLANYYSPLYRKIDNQFNDIFIPLNAIKDKAGNEIKEAFSIFEEVVKKRMALDLIEPDALMLFVGQSGGLFRDLIQYLRNACSTAISLNQKVITLEIANAVIDLQIDKYIREFDFETFSASAKKLSDSKSKMNINNETSIFFLAHLFALEYKSVREKTIWYDLHPCLKSAIKRISNVA